MYIHREIPLLVTLYFLATLCVHILYHHSKFNSLPSASSGGHKNTKHAPSRCCGIRPTIFFIFFFETLCSIRSFCCVYFLFFIFFCVFISDTAVFRLILSSLSLLLFFFVQNLSPFLFSLDYSAGAFLFFENENIFISSKLLLEEFWWAPRCRPLLSSAFSLHIFLLSLYTLLCFSFTISSPTNVYHR